MSSFFADKKLPAFTLLELITGMIVSAIVLATIFTAWHIVTKQSQQLSIHAQANRDRFLLHSFVVSETEAADSVYRNEKEMFCYRKNGSGFTLLVTYNMQEEFVTRKTRYSIDTFFVKSFSSLIHLPHAGIQP